MSKKIAIAVEGDVEASVGTSPFPPADSGTWTAGEVTEIACGNVASGSKKGLFSATCIFSFVGSQTIPNGSVTVNGSETVNLEASASALTSEGEGLLLDEAESSGLYGNTLKVIASQQILTITR